MVHYDPEFYRGKRVFVTGHTGFKGSWLCKMLLMAGAEVTGYSLQPPTQPNLFSIAGVEDKMHSVIGNSFGKNRIFISVITSDGKNAAPGITICYTEGSDHITVNSRLQNNTCYLIGAVKDKNEFETALRELGYIE